MKKLSTLQIILLVVFWPIGIIYLITHRRGGGGGAHRAESAGRSSAGGRPRRVDSSRMEIEREFHTKVVGVSFDNPDGSSRQAIIRRCHEGEEVIFKPVPTVEYPDAIGVFNARGQQLGHLNARLAEELKSRYPTNPMKASIVNITGGGDGQSYGCNLLITIYA